MEDKRGISYQCARVKNKIKYNLTFCGLGFMLGKQKALSEEPLSLPLVACQHKIKGHWPIVVHVWTKSHAKQAEEEAIVEIISCITIPSATGRKES